MTKVRPIMLLMAAVVAFPLGCQTRPLHDSGGVGRSLTLDSATLRDAKAKMPRMAYGLDPWYANRLDRHRVVYSGYQPSRRQSSQTLTYDSQISVGSNQRDHFYRQTREIRTETVIR